MKIFGVRFASFSKIGDECTVTRIIFPADQIEPALVFENQLQSAIR